MNIQEAESLRQYNWFPDRDSNQARSLSRSLLGWLGFSETSVDLQRTVWRQTSSRTQQFPAPGPCADDILKRCSVHEE
jgi:hypothetical protein